MEADERGDVAREYRRVSLTGLVLLVATAAMSAAAVLLGPRALVSGFTSLYRWIFLAAAIVAAFACLMFHGSLASSRPLRRPPEGAARRSVAAQVASLASVLIALPFSVVLLGFTLRVVLGGTLLDFLGFLGLGLALWALFFPRRSEFEEWVRLRTDRQE